MCAGNGDFHSPLHHHQQHHVHDCPSRSQVIMLMSVVMIVIMIMTVVKVVMIFTIKLVVIGEVNWDWSS